MALSNERQALLRRKKMRGGLGRTLLTAFLLLAIVPLSAMSVFAIQRTQQASQRQQAQQVALLVEGYRAQIDLTVQRLQDALAHQSLSAQWDFEPPGEPIGESPALPDWVSRPTVLQAGGRPLQLWVPIEREEGWRATTVRLAPIIQALRLPPNLRPTESYLWSGETIVGLDGEAASLPPAVLTRLQAAPAAPVLLVSSPTSETLMVGHVPLGEGQELLVTYRGANAQDGPDSLAAALVAAALLVALAATVAAALLTRQITRPLYELTRVAVQIARGDLTQRAQVAQDNELGILALAFNTMTAQLQDTLETLEERVEQRTEELRRANMQNEVRATQLAQTAEIAASLSAIHELEALLTQGSQLICEAFDYQRVTVWLLGRRPGRDPGLSLRADSAAPADSKVLSVPAPLIALAERSLQAGMVRDEGAEALALPLRMADNVIGSLLLVGGATLAEQKQPHLQILADSFAVAIENARASEMERAALEKLKRLESHRAQFLGEMSHELSTALNSIIGFSRLMLKETEGPLTDMQRSDLTYINRNGTHLLSLLDGMLELIDSGQ